MLRCYGEDSTHAEPAKEETSAFSKVKAAQTNRIKLAGRNCNYRKYKPCPQWPQRTRKGRIRPRSHASLATKSTRRGLACRSRRSCRQPEFGCVFFTRNNVQILRTFLSALTIEVNISLHIKGNNTLYKQYGGNQPNLFTVIAAWLYFDKLSMLPVCHASI